jgi:hypothetical protein
MNDTWTIFLVYHDYTKSAESCQGLCCPPPGWVVVEAAKDRQGCAAPAFRLTVSQFRFRSRFSDPDMWPGSIGELT